MALYLTGNTSNITIDSTSGITFPNSTLQASAGAILQVINATYGTKATSASSTFADTGLTATITPKFSTSRILVTVNMAGCGKDTGDTYLQLRLLQGATTIANFERLGGYTGAAGRNFIGTCSISYLDSPSTTSATTYKVQFASGANVANAYINIDGGGSSPISTITLMEIA